MGNELARAGGVTRGLPLSDAKARIPELVSEVIDRDADAKALGRLIQWLIRFTPIVARDGDDALMLETTGCDHLFGGEAGMAKELRSRLRKVGYEARMAFASTPAAAYALARGGAELTICGEGEEREGLQGLLMETLRLSPETCQLLRRFGLTRVGQLYGLDRKALARRFQSAEAAGRVVLRLDQALGLRHEPLKPFRPKPDFSVRLSCPEPVASTEAVWEGLRRLTTDICDELKEAGQGARSFHFHAFRADGGVSSISVRAARPVRNEAHILRLFAERIEKMDPGFGIDLFVLEARLAGPVEMGPMALSSELSGKARDDEALSALADRVSARLGDGAVTLRWPVASYLPERSEDFRVFEGVWPEWTGRPLTGPRPLRLFPVPEPVQVLAEVPDGPPLRFVWRKQTRRVTRADGPERIAPEWWRFFEISALSDCSVADPLPSAQGDLRPTVGRVGPHTSDREVAGAAAKAGNSTEQNGNITPFKARPSAFTAGLSSDCSTADPRPSGSGPSAPAQSLMLSTTHEQGQTTALSATHRESGESRAEGGQTKKLPRAKDYYRVEDEEGRRYWIARVGLYHDGRGGAPYWVMEGLFP